MDNLISVFDLGDQECLIHEISDEALEATAVAAKAQSVIYTLAACTGLSACPA
jgi:hypothetical protein